MTTLTAESALETARRSRYESLEDLARALIQTRIEAMQDCAREHCEYCGRNDNLECIELLYCHEWPGPTPERRVRRTCPSAYEHREISRLTAELEKLR